MLTDMEELLHKVLNPDIAGYMEEAYRCYGIGAYRGCIIMSYIAVFDDIRGKLGELAKIDSKAKEISADINKLADGQKVFENTMVDQLAKEKLLSEAARKKIAIIQNVRNSAAHPSGIHATAEQARMVYVDVIQSFLSQPLLKTTHGVDRIVSILGHGNLFPTSSAPDIRAVSWDLVKPIHSGAFVYLIRKLAEEISGSNNQARINANSLLLGCGMIESAPLEMALKSQIIVERSSDSRYHTLISKLISVNGRILLELEEVHLSRVSSILQKNVMSPGPVGRPANGHPITQFISIIDELGEDAWSHFPEFCGDVIKTFPSSDEIVNLGKKETKVKEALVEHWVDLAGSSDYGKANKMAGYIPLLEEKHTDLLTDLDAFELLLGCLESAEHGAFEMKGLRGDNFSAVPQLKNKAVTYYKDNDEKAGRMIDDCALVTKETVRSALLDLEKS